jgi:hypothetical protein
MSFGLRNAAQTFQRFTDDILQGLDFCFAYLDILVFSLSLEEHEQHLQAICAPRGGNPGTTSRRSLRPHSQGLSTHYLEAGTPQGLRRVQGEIVTRHSPGESRSIRATCIHHRRLHVHHECRAAATSQEAWQPLAFSRKFIQAQQKYSAYDHELLVIYEAVKHFRHMLEARHFIIFTEHIPITFAFQQKRDKCLPRQFNHLDFAAHFTTDIRHISGQDNVVADALVSSPSLRHHPTTH